MSFVYIGTYRYSESQKENIHQAKIYTSNHQTWLLPLKDDVLKKFVGISKFFAKFFVSILKTRYITIFKIKITVIY